MRNLKKIVARIISFIMIFTLLPMGNLKAVTKQEESFGYLYSRVCDIEGVRSLSVEFEKSELDKIASVNVSVSTATSNENGYDSKKYKDYKLTYRTPTGLYLKLENTDMIDFGDYYVDKLVINYKDTTTKIIYNSLFYKDLAGNDKENGTLLRMDFFHKQQSKIYVKHETVKNSKETVILGEEQETSFEISNPDEDVKVTSAYVTYRKQGVQDTSSDKIMEATTLDGVNFTSKLKLQNSLDTGNWLILQAEFKDNYDRTHVRPLYAGEFRVVSANTDITAPKLESIDLTDNTYDYNKDYYNGDEEAPMFKATITDDNSGVDDVTMQIVDKNDESKREYIHLYPTSDSQEHGSFHGEIGNWIENGDYEVEYLSVLDKAGNGITYHNPKYNDGNGIEYDFSNISLKVINKKEKPVGTEEKIKVKDIKKNFEKAKNGYDLDFTITVESNVGIKYSNLYYDTNKYITADKNDRSITNNNDGTYTLNFKGEKYDEALKYMASKDYKIEILEIYTEQENEKVIYNSKLYTEDYDGEEKYDFSKLDFSCENPDEDITAPVIEDIKLDNSVILPGGKTKIEVKVKEDNSGIENHLTIGYRNGSFNEYYYLDYSEEDKAFTGEIEIPAYVTTGVYAISYISIRDIAGNSSSYSMWDEDARDLLTKGSILVKSDLNEKMPPVISSNLNDGESYKNSIKPVVSVDHGTFTMKLNGKDYNGEEVKTVGNHDLYIVATGVDGSQSTLKINFKVVSEINDDTTVDEIIDQINNSTERNIEIELNNSDRVVDEKIFEAIKGKDKTVTFTQDDGTEWSFNGMDIKDGANISNVKLSVSSMADEENRDDIDAIDADARVIHFDHHGVLPGKATVKIFVGDAEHLKDKDLTFYYYNPETKKPEKVQGPLSIDNDGYVTVEITHCSDYFLSETDNLDTENKDVIINVKEKELKMKKGDTAKLTVTVDPTDAKLTYSSLDEKVATVKNGVVTAIGAGETVVKVEAGNSVAFVNVIVSEEEIAGLPEKPENPENPSAPKEEAKKEDGKTEAAKTGDNNGVLFTFMLMILSAGVFVKFRK